MSLRGDLGARAVVHTGRMEWEASPSAGVWRKRLHRVGPTEAGEVTSVVRFDAGAEFHAHDHPDGEEILVLEGVFSDERGDWPAGSYLLSPEGFRHHPYSRAGCTLFVKLRQYRGGRETVALRLADLDWSEEGNGARLGTLHERAETAETVRVERWPPGCRRRIERLPGGLEVFVLEGGFRESSDDLTVGSWLRVPCGGSLAATSGEGALVWTKVGGVARLTSSELAPRQPG